MMIRRALLLIAFVSSTASLVSAQILRVDGSSSRGGDGSSWEQALGDLQGALRLAREPAAIPIREIWVAAGTYRPAVTAESRLASFELPRDVQLYGGFAGGEIRRSERNPGRNPTILSGDLAADDVPGLGNSHDNALHVVTARASGAAVLDGFTVRGGHADDPTVPFGDLGGGILVLGGGPRFVDLSIEHNRARSGGGISIDGPGPEVIIEDCRFRACEAETTGTAIRVVGIGAKIDACAFEENQLVAGGGSGLRGGAVAATSQAGNQEVVLRDCRLLDNRAGHLLVGAEGRMRAELCTMLNRDVRGAGATVMGGILSLQSCILWSRSVVQIAGSAGITVDHSCIKGGYPGSGNLAADPQLVDPIAGDLRLRSTSPCIDAGDPRLRPRSFDPSGDPRLLDGDLDGTLTVDMGVDEFNALHLAVVRDIGSLRISSTGRAGLNLMFAFGNPGITVLPTAGIASIDTTRRVIAFPLPQTPNVVLAFIPDPVLIGTMVFQEIGLNASGATVSNPVTLQFEN